jgi:hypothetical protein
MGADFFLCVLEIKHTKSVALAKAKDLNLTKDDFHTFEDAGIWFDWTGDDAELVKEMRARLLEAVEAVYSATQRRDCSYFYVDGDRVFYATEGMGIFPGQSYEVDSYLYEQLFEVSRLRGAANQAMSGMTSSLSSNTPKKSWSRGWQACYNVLQCKCKCGQMTYASAEKP